jgi:HEAT repeat protein
VVEQLLDLSRDEEADVRSSAADALGLVGERAIDEGTVSRVVEQVLELGPDEEADVRSSAAFALSLVGERAIDEGAVGRVFERLLDLSRDEDADVRSRAAFALGSLGERATDESAVGRVLECLLDLSPDTEAPLRVATARIAAVQGNERALQILFQWLADRRKAHIAASFFSSVSEVAYEAAIIILNRVAPEPPTSFEEPPQPVSGPWDKN